MEHADKENIAARFAQMWNEIVTSFREEDLIDNRWLDFLDKFNFKLNYFISLNLMAHFWHREKELLLVPYVSDQALGVVQWPPFLLASKVIIYFYFTLMVIHCIFFMVEAMSIHVLFVS